jgi:malate/lactate dehydrogenase
LDKIRNSAVKIEDLGKAIEKMENLGMDTTQAKQQLAALKDAMAVDVKKVEAMLTDEKAVLHDMAQLADGTKSLAQWIPEVRVALQAKGVAGTVSDQLSAQAVSVTDSDVLTQLITDPLTLIIPFLLCIDVK